MTHWRTMQPFLVMAHKRYHHLFPELHDNVQSGGPNRTELKETVHGHKRNPVMPSVYRSC